MLHSHALALPLTLGFAALSALSAACDSTPPVKTAAGETINGISYDELFPLSNEAHEVAFHGDEFRRAAELMDKKGVTGLTGSYEATGVLDKSTLVLTFHVAGGKERKVAVKNCAEPHLCAFFEEAVASGLVKKIPVVCRDATACTKK